MYDFDWVGPNLAIGDGEGRTIALPTEPSNDQTGGAETPGLLDAQFNAWLRGGFNLDFTKGPPDPTQNIDVATSTTGSNFIPGWRFVQSSNTAVTLKQNRDTTIPSGSNLRFSFAAGAAADEAYAEAILPVRGDLAARASDWIEFWAKASSSTAGTFVLEGQYLDVQGNLVGSVTRFSLNPNTAYDQNILFGVNANRMAPATAKLLRLRIIVKRNAGTGAFTLDVADGQRYIGQPYGVIFGDQADPTRSPGVVYQRSGLLVASADVWNGGPGGVIGPHLVQLEFVAINIPAAATTEMQPSDNALGMATPRLRMPWGGSIVGLSYRMSNLPTAGQVQVQPTVGGASVWTAFTITSGSAVQASATQAIGADTFVAGDVLGVQLVANGAYLPTTRNLHCTLWLAMHYDGT